MDQKIQIDGRGVDQELEPEPTRVRDYHSLWLSLPCRLSSGGWGGGLRGAVNRLGRARLDDFI